MLASTIFRPTFLVRSVVRALGGRACTTGSLPPEAFQFLLPTGGDVEEVWTEFEPLILALTLAGYEVPAIVVTAPVNQALSGYLTLLCETGSVFYSPNSPLALIGATPPAGTAISFSLRLTVRRSLGLPSRVPPLDLTGVAGYARHPNAADPLASDGMPFGGQPDPFASPDDGWIHLYSQTFSGDADGLVRHTGAAATRDAIVAALAGAWQNGAAGVGLLWCFDPTWWEPALDRNVLVWPFDWLCTEVWAWLQQPAEMTDFLQRAPGDRDASFGRIVHRSDAERAMSDYDPDRFRSRGPLKKSLDAIEARAGWLQARNANLSVFLPVIEKVHYAIALFVLHECGLIRILPLPFEHTADIPLVDLTGWYETAGQSEPSGRPLIETMQLNQAGDHVEGWMYDGQLRRWDLVGSLDITSYDPASGPPTAPTFRFGATRSRNGSDTGGSIELIPVLDRWADDFAIRVSFGGAIYAMVRRSREAMVSPVLVLAAAGASVPADMEAYMARLHSLSEQGIGRAIALLVSEIEQMTAGFTSWSVAIMLTFDRVKTQLEDDGIIEFNSDFTPVDTPMLRRFRAEAIRGLIQTPIPSANGTDGWTQLLRIFASTGASSANLQTLLGAGAGGGHAYTFQTAGVGIQGEGSLGLKFEAGGFQILCPVEHLSTCAPPGIDPASHAWSALYTGQILQASWGPGGIEGALNFITASGSNDLSTSYAWAPEDFAPSVFGAFGASVSVSAYYGVGGTLAPPVPPINIFGVPITGTQGEGYVFINRYGGIGYGASTGWSASVGIGITATGVNPSASIGPTIGVLQAQIDNTTAPPAVPIATPPLQVTLNDAVAQGFAVDSADLLPQTRDLLLRFIAQYRGVFESPSAFVQIEGDASPTGSEPYNESLSWRRALAVYAFIRSALTAPPSDEWSREQHALVLPDNRVYLVAYGETRARRDGVDDGVEDDDWRRVKITLNDRVMVVL